MNMRSVFFGSGNIYPLTKRKPRAPDLMLLRAVGRLNKGNAIATIYPTLSQDELLYLTPDQQRLMHNYDNKNAYHNKSWNDNVIGCDTVDELACAYRDMFDFISEACDNLGITGTDRVILAMRALKYTHREIGSVVGRTRQYVARRLLLLRSLFLGGSCANE